MRARCLAVDDVAAARAAAAMADHLGASPEYRAAQRVVLYAELPGEVPIGPLLELARRERKALLWPRAEGAAALALVPWDRIETLVPGRYGVRQPPASVPASALAAGDLALVPGLAFDEGGGRLGRGGGAWDRTLAEAVGVFTVGIGYEFQVVPRVPREAHDRAVAALLTERGMRRCREG